MAAHLGGIVRRKLTFSVLAAAALVALTPLSASAARSPNTGSATACPGGTLLAAVSTHRLPAGSTAYTYKLTDGTSFENVAPPSGFDPATASSALLSELNFPQRPTGATAMRTWGAQVAPFVNSGINGSDKFCEMARAAPEPTATRPAVGAAPSASASGTTSFSGYELRSGPYHRAVGQFKQPTTNTTIRSMSTWIGLNSSAGSRGRLIQAGAGDEAGTGGAPFWELYCSGGSADGCNAPVIDYSHPAGAGATVSVNVAYNGLTAYFQVAINGRLAINTSYRMKSGSVSGGVADFWTERTGGDYIPRTSNIVFSGSRTYASYSSRTSVPFGSQHYYAVEMTTDGKFYSPPCGNSHILMYPANVTSGGFVNHYCRSN
jgi:hypothetical protein